MEPWITQMLRRAVSRQVIAWAVVALALLGTAAYSRRYITNFIQGPYAVTGGELQGVSDAASTPKHFVKVSGTRVIDTGLEHVTIRRKYGQENRRVDAKYVILVFEKGQKALVVKAGSTMPVAAVFEGTLRPIDGKLRENLFSGENAKMEAHLLPYVLETAGFRTAGYIGGACGAVALLLLAIFGRRSFNYSRDLQSHPLMKRLQSWGDPMSISAAAEREYTAPPRLKTSAGIVTDNFVFQRGPFIFNVSRFEDLVWAYKKITKKSVNLIPVGKDYAAMLIFYGSSVEITSKEPKVDELLAYAAERAPWAIFGHTPELETAFKKQQQEFCAAVESRRQEVMKVRAASADHS